MYTHSAYGRVTLEKKRRLKKKTDIKFIPIVPMGVSRSRALTRRLPPTRFSLKASMALMMSFIFCFLMRFKSCVSAPLLQRVSFLSCVLKFDRYACLTARKPHSPFFWMPSAHFSQSNPTPKWPWVSVLNPTPNAEYAEMCTQFFLMHSAQIMTWVSVINPTLNAHKHLP